MNLTPIASIFLSCTLEKLLVKGLWWKDIVPLESGDAGFSGQFSAKWTLFLSSLGLSFPIFRGTSCDTSGVQALLWEQGLSYPL